MSNTLKIIFYIVLFVCAYSSYGITLIKSCNNCSEVQYKYKAKEVSINGAYVVVIDSENSSVVAFRIIRSKVDDDIDVSIPKSVSVPDEIKSTFSEAILSRNDYLDDLQSDFGSTSINFSIIESDIYGAGFYAIQSTESDQSSDSINAFDFMSNSSLRRQTFDRLTTQYPSYMKFNGLWNKTVNIIGTSFGGQAVSISADLSVLAFMPTLTFEDGSYVIAEYNMDTKTFVVKEGVDEGGNDIPNNASYSIGGVYKINSSKHYRDLQEYMSYFWLIKFISRGTGQSCTMSCRVITSERYECTYHCK